MTGQKRDSRNTHPRGGRRLARAWFEVLVTPRQFFSNVVTSGDQAPGLIFAMVIVGIEELTRLLLIEDAVLVLFSSRVLSIGVILGVAVLLVTPAVLHLVAGLQTLILILLVEDRASVSQTVQVIAYSIAPCVLAGFPIPILRVACAVYGSFLFLLGISIVHDLSLRRGLIVTILPAGLVFGYGFRGFSAAASILTEWYLI